jgi:hypothetical protein
LAGAANIPDIRGSDYRDRFLPFVRHALEMAVRLGLGQSRHQLFRKLSRMLEIGIFR